MKEHPILFTPEMAQSAHVGDKTKTRRMIKNPNKIQFYKSKFRDCCKYKIGDRLWVKETWASTEQLGIPPCDAEICYKGHCPDWEFGCIGWRWKPSIHMPKLACRTILKVIGIDVEPLRLITPEDAIAEGCPHDRTDNPIGWFKKIWEGCYGEGSWENNPWVWVITFKRLEVKK